MGKAQDSTRMTVSFGGSLFYLTPTKSNELLANNVIRGGFAGLIQQRLKENLYLNIKVDAIIPGKKDTKAFLAAQIGITKIVHRSRFTGFIGTGIGKFMISADYTYVFKHRTELSSGLLYSFNGIAGVYVNARLDFSNLFGY